MRNAILAVCCLALLASAQDHDTLWTRAVDNEVGMGVTVNSLDQAYVASAAPDWSNMFYDMVVTRLAPDGAVVWAESLRTMNRAALQDLKVISTPDNRVVVAASTIEWDPIISKNYLFARDTCGSLLWEHVFLYDLQNFELDVAADQQGNAFLVSQAFTDSSGPDWHIVKVDADGEVQWERYFDGPGHANDGVLAAAADGAGGVYAAGWSTDSTGHVLPTAARFDSEGVAVWSRMVRPDGCMWGKFTDIVVGQDGNVCLVGSDNTSSISPGPVVSLSPSGDSVWYRYVSGAPGFAVVDLQGNLCIAGHSPGGQDVVTRKLAPDGSLLWERTFDGPEGLADYVNDIETDRFGNVLVCGFSVDSYEPEVEVADVVAYSASGSLLWTERYLLVGHNALAWARGLKADSEGCLYVTGVSYRERYVDASSFAIKYGATPSGVEERPIVSGCGAGQTFCRGILPLPGNADAVLLDISGRRVMSLQPGENDISRLSPGVYFIHAKGEGGGMRAARKVVIQR